MRSVGWDAGRLKDLHDAGTVPSLSDLDGRANGTVLTVPAVRELRLWRGKVFSQGPAGQVTGYNRLGIAGVERLRYRFDARVGPSRFGVRMVCSSITTTLTTHRM